MSQATAFLEQVSRNLEREYVANQSVLAEPATEERLSQLEAIAAAMRQKGFDAWYQTIFINAPLFVLHVRLPQSALLDTLMTTSAFNAEGVMFCGASVYLPDKGARIKCEVVFHPESGC